MFVVGDRRDVTQPRQKTESMSARWSSAAGSSEWTQSAASSSSSTPVLLPRAALSGSASTTPRTTRKGKALRKHKVSDEAIKHHLRIMQFRREPAKYTKQKYAAIYEELVKAKEEAVEEAVAEEAETVVVDEAQAVVVPPQQRWAALLDGVQMEEVVFDYGGCVLAF